MYKAGKNWVVAPLITVGVVTGIVMGTSLSMADEVSVNNEDTKVVLFLQFKTLSLKFPS
ncbi:KxYKxGKxW signal peptide domain-containing protein [Ligilactobacillus murinus]|uniref:KxYKxGKxW signal peptide domain-containing protein n=1 Tax=Ligilactobacillus murinus TaxID=1622 RepID=UPI001F03795C|nr:KxYKxGKxW signal peptide domain-containing protein [Ligilactobacillus murinus]